MPDLKTNVLYYGDNLDILRGHIPDGSVDLIYLDPPFNSQQQYNVRFKEPTGQGSTAQVRELMTEIGDENLGLFITLEPPTEPMRVEATTAGFHSSLLWEREFPRIQIFTVAELLEGKQPELPGKLSGFARAPRVGGRGRQMALSESPDE